MTAARGCPAGKYNIRRIQLCGRVATCLPRLWETFRHTVYAITCACTAITPLRDALSRLARTRRRVGGLRGSYDDAGTHAPHNQPGHKTSHASPPPSPPHASAPLRPLLRRSSSPPKTTSALRSPRNSLVVVLLLLVVVLLLRLVERVPALEGQRGRQRGAARTAQADASARTWGPRAGCSRRSWRARERAPPAAAPWQTNAPCAAESSSCSVASSAPPSRSATAASARRAPCARKQQTGGALFSAAQGAGLWRQRQCAVRRAGGGAVSSLCCNERVTSVRAVAAQSAAAGQPGRRHANVERCRGADERRDQREKTCHARCTCTGSDTAHRGSDRASSSRPRARARAGAAHER